MQARIIGREGLERQGEGDRDSDVSRRGDHPDRVDPGQPAMGGRVPAAVQPAMQGHGEQARRRQDHKEKGGRCHHAPAGQTGGPYHAEETGRYRQRREERAYDPADPTLVETLVRSERVRRDLGQLGIDDEADRPLEAGVGRRAHQLGNDYRGHVSSVDRWLRGAVVGAGSHTSPMSDDTDSEAVLRSFWEHIDAQDWDAMAALLAPDFEARYVHTGEVLDGEAMVRLNREYPGRWHTEIEDLVSSGQRAVSRAVITGGGQTFHVASFATARSGLLVSLVELWTDGAADPPEHRPTG